MAMTRHQTVGRVMRTPPVTVTSDAKASDACDKLSRADVGSVIVVVDDGGDALGIITERDILKRLVQAGNDPTTTQVTEVMSTPLVTIEHDRSLREALTIMDMKDLRRLAVARNGQLVGQLTRVRAFSSRPYVEGVALGAIIGAVLGTIVMMLVL